MNRDIHKIWESYNLENNPPQPTFEIGDVVQPINHKELNSEQTWNIIGVVVHIYRSKDNLVQLTLDTKYGQMFFLSHQLKKIGKVSLDKREKAWQILDI